MSVEAANKPMDKWRADGRVRGDNGDNGTGSQLRVGNWVSEHTCIYGYARETNGTENVIKKLAYIHTYIRTH